MLSNAISLVRGRPLRTNCLPSSVPRTCWLVLLGAMAAGCAAGEPGELDSAGRGAFTLVGDAEACGDVALEGGTLRFAALPSTAQAFGITRWHLQPSFDGKVSTQTVSGVDAEGNAIALGYLSLDLEALQALGEEAELSEVLEGSDKTLELLDGGALTGQQTTALFIELGEALPSEACLRRAAGGPPSVVEGPEDEGVTPLAMSDDPLLFARVGGAGLPGGNGEPWTCREEQLAFDAAELGLKLSVLTGRAGVGFGSRIQAVAEASRALACCRGNTNAVWSKGESCGCPERSGNNRPILRRLSPSLGQPDAPLAGLYVPPAQQQYQCQACPESRPLWNDVTKRCVACPGGAAWDSENESCGSPQNPFDGIYRPNTTGAGSDPNCVYRVTLEFINQNRHTEPVDRWSHRAWCDPEPFGPKPWTQSYESGYAVGIHPGDGSYCDPRVQNCPCGDGKCWASEYLAMRCESSSGFNYTVTSCPSDGTWHIETNVIAQGPINGLTFKLEPRTNIPDEANVGFVRPTVYLEAGGRTIAVPYGDTSNYAISSPGSTFIPRHLDVVCPRTSDARIKLITPFQGGYINRSVSRHHSYRRDGGWLNMYFPRCNEEQPVNPIPGPGEPGADGCEGGQVRGTWGGCVCPPEGPPRNAEGVCACPEGKVWDAAESRCVRGPEYCFGAVGNNCVTLQDDQVGVLPDGLVTCAAGTVGVPEGATCIADVHALPPEGDRKRQAVSVGSLLHDQCCSDAPEGFACGGNNTQPGRCFGEFMRATRDVVSGRTWPITFDPAAPIDARIFDASGALTPYAGQLLAPGGAEMRAEDARFCASQHVARHASGTTVCALRALGGHGTRSVVRSRPEPSVFDSHSGYDDLASRSAGGDSDMQTHAGRGGRCERFEGNAEDLRLALTDGYNRVVDPREQRSGKVSVQRWQQYISGFWSRASNRWVWRDEHHQLQAFALLESLNEVGSQKSLRVLAGAADHAVDALMDCVLDAEVNLGGRVLSVSALDYQKAYWASVVARTNEGPLPVFGTEYGRDREGALVTGYTFLPTYGACGLRKDRLPMLSDQPPPAQRKLFRPLANNLDAGTPRQVISAHGAFAGDLGSFVVPEGMALVDFMPPNYLMMMGFSHRVLRGEDLTGIHALMTQGGNFAADRLLTPLEEEDILDEYFVIGGRGPGASRPEDIFEVPGATKLSDVMTDLHARGVRGNIYLLSCNATGPGAPAGLLFPDGLYENDPARAGGDPLCAPEDLAQREAALQAGDACGGERLYGGAFECVDRLNPELCTVAGAAASARRQRNAGCRSALLALSACYDPRLGSFDASLADLAHFEEDCARCLAL